MSTDQLIATILLSVAALASLLSALDSTAPRSIRLLAGGVGLAILTVLLVVAGAISAKGA